ncbi:hypothetical protein [Granulicella sp. dw_53]|uniref:hypothetical protein n=1 Tax=Granulicella sp. dw_53 TaxID=2719792 RepID=UPI001BD48ABA|nr:hypothetical protein [Granulicella sp. dw_53]
MFRNAYLRKALILVAHLLATSHIFLWIASSGVAFAQSQTESPSSKDFTRIMGAEDNEIADPGAPLASGQSDPLALQAITAFLAAVNGRAWSGMQATGTLTSPEAPQSQNPAVLTIKDGDSFRLDVNTTTGQRSTRIHGTSGIIQESNGTKHTLPPATALDGLFAFPQLMMITFPDAQTSVLDRGTVAINGRSLHRISVQHTFSTEATSVTVTQPTIVDLYFDPTTHLLLKSAAWIQVDTADRAKYLQVVTYGDYQTVNGIVLPFSYSQTLNGQRQWSLQLTNIQLSPAVETSLFTF